MKMENIPAVESLCTEFREHLKRFYSGLKLAPPYDSVEQAVRRLASNVRSLSAADQQSVLLDAGRRWAQYRDAFMAAGLHHKHRGIISGLVRNRSAVNLPAEYDLLLALYESGGRSD